MDMANPNVSEREATMKRSAILSNVMAASRLHALILVAGLVCFAGCGGVELSDDELPGQEGTGGKADCVGSCGGKADFTVAEVNKLLGELEVARYGRDAAPMGWAHVRNNCFTRAQAVYYYFNFGELPQYGESTLDPEDVAGQRAMMARIRALEHSKVRMMRFTVAGTIAFSATYASDDSEVNAKLKGVRTDGVAWSDHMVALVSTDEGDRIIDMGSSRRALTFEEWEASFVPAALQGTCARNDSEAEEAIRDYNISVNLRKNPALPQTACAFREEPMFSNSDGSQLSDAKLYPSIWDGISNMTQSTKTVRSLSPMYFPKNPTKIPLVKIVLGESLHRP